MTDSPIKIAVLDDYQNIALKMADWSSISGNPEIKVFNDHISELEPLVEPVSLQCGLYHARANADERRAS
jgi:hypothetical protein